MVGFEQDRCSRCRRSRRRRPTRDQLIIIAALVRVELVVLIIVVAFDLASESFPPRDGFWRRISFPPLRDPRDPAVATVVAPVLLFQALLLGVNLVVAVILRDALERNLQHPPGRVRASTSVAAASVSARRPAPPQASSSARACCPRHQLRRHRRRLRRVHPSVKSRFVGGASSLAVVCPKSLGAEKTRTFGCGTVIPGTLHGHLHAHHRVTRSSSPPQETPRTDDSDVRARRRGARPGVRAHVST